MIPKEKNKIFISYARSEAEFALKLGKDLRSSGMNVWIDQLDVAVGALGPRDGERA